MITVDVWHILAQNLSSELLWPKAKLSDIPVLSDASRYVHMNKRAYPQTVAYSIVGLSFIGSPAVSVMTCDVRCLFCITSFILLYWMPVDDIRTCLLLVQCPLQHKY